jgi:hypothetical protein
LFLCVLCAAVLGFLLLCERLAPARRSALHDRTDSPS